MTWKKKIAGTAAMFILGFIFILPVLWIVMNSIKTSPEIAADFLALPKSLYLDNFKNAMESMNFLVALKKFCCDYIGSYAGRAVRIVCRCFRNLTSSWENLTESVSVFCFRTDRAVSCSYDSYFCTCYKYQSYQFPWRNYHS